VDITSKMLEEVRIPSAQVNNIEESIQQWRNAIDNDNDVGDENSAQEFVKRLATFKRETYFAKPECVSPLIAARFGYVYYCSASHLGSRS